MKSATAICLFGIVSCLSCPAQAPLEQGQAAPAPRPPADKPSETVQMRSIAPVPGLPVPMDLGQADAVRLSALNVTVALKHQVAMVSYICALEVPEGVPGKHIAVGVPFKYSTPDERANAALAEPLRHLPFNKAVLSIGSGVNDLVCENKLFTGPHPQMDSPVMTPLAGINHWLVAHVPNKPGTQVLNIRFEVPYQRDMVISPANGVKMGAPKLNLLAQPMMIWTGLPQKAEINVYASEMVNASVKRHSALDDKIVTTTPTGVYSWSLLNAEGRLLSPTVELTPMPAWQLNNNGNLTLNGVTGKLTNDYEVSASSTLSKDPYGQPCSAENLKKADGFWAENVSGDGQGETLELKLKSPAKLMGVMIETGISPLSDPNDTEARRHPNIAYSMYSRPKVFKVTLNDEYGFDATLRDDWTPQLIIPPAYDKPVHTIKLQLQSVYPGTAGADTYIGILKPVIR